MPGRASGNRAAYAAGFDRVIDTRVAENDRIRSRDSGAPDERKDAKVPGRTSSWVHFAFPQSDIQSLLFLTQAALFPSLLNVLIYSRRVTRKVFLGRKFRGAPRRTAPLPLHSRILCTLREGSTYSRVNSDRFAAVREVTSRMTIMRTMEGYELLFIQS